MSSAIAPNSDVLVGTSLQAPPVVSGLQPPMFCISRNKKPDMHCPWPLTTRIRVKTVGAVPRNVRAALEDTLREWQDRYKTNTLYVDWVNEAESSHVRIAIGPGPSWCAVGTTAETIPASEPTAYLGLRGWQSRGHIWKKEQLYRAVRHMWGHIFGLDHACRKESFQYKSDLILTYCAEAGLSVDQSMAFQGTGVAAMVNSDSVMHYDRPAGLFIPPQGSSGNYGGTKIDADSLQQLKYLYPSYRDIACFTMAACDLDGFVVGQKVNNVIRSKYVAVSKTYNICGALSRIDMGLNGDFRLATFATDFQWGKGWRINQGSWSDTELFGANSVWMSFEEGDDRIQAGRLCTVDILKEQQRVQDPSITPGMKLSKRIVFSRPYRIAPKVIAVLNDFAYDKAQNPRMDVYANDIDEKGFTLHFDAEFDTKNYNTMATWVAHASDDPTVRSGRFDFGSGDQSPRTCTFEGAMDARPRYIWHGISGFDLPNHVPLRIQMDIKGWSNRSVDALGWTWERSSSFFKFKGAFVALM
ncbi:hypothetical protein BCV70DRAFT_67032 [Testicularia cyperi]|uniref:H-type lectin domain-containing protein n=1 Tax=Testicularia cyperi TaxID=1882483 RepID=A0A317XH37_9BASI|nr:hypothetical protein BCV70DRAFT_67032 [Testicularia cyperi]